MAINLPQGLLQLLGVTDSPLINLTNGNDAFSSTGNIDQHIIALGGNDAVKAGGGSDIVEGGAGNDAIQGEDGNDLIEGGAGNDALNGGNGIDTLAYSLSSAGVTIALTNNGAGNGSGGDAQNDAYSNFENIVGSAFVDSLTGNNLVNVLAGLAGNDTLRGMNGNDVLVGGAGADLLDGGNGLDTADYSTSGGPVHLVLGGVSSGGDAEGDTLVSIERLVGTAGADVFDGSASLTGFSADGGGGADSMFGGHGHDTLSIGGGASTFAAGFAALAEEGGTLDGGDGDDTLQGGDGNDLLIGGAGSDLYEAGDGDDTITCGPGGDTVDGGAGFDTINYSGSPEPVQVVLGGAESHGGNAEGDTLSSIEGVIGTTGDDVIDGSAELEGLVLDGGGGNDWLIGGQGNDTLSISDGAGLAAFAALAEQGAALLGGGGDDTLNGGNNDDFLGGEDGNDTINGFGGNDTLSGGEGNDYLIGDTGDDILQGGQGVDTISYETATGSGDGISLTLATDETVASFSAGSTDAGADTFDDVIENVTGTNLNDKIRADSFGVSGALDHIFIGLGGNDELTGGDGNDTLIGGQGQDRLGGGRANDTFVFQAISDSPDNAPDFISEGFNVGGADFVDVSQIDADLNTEGDEAFTLVEATSRDGVGEGQLAYFRTGNSGGEIVARQAGEGGGLLVVKTFNTPPLDMPEFIL